MVFTLDIPDEATAREEEKAEALCLRNRIDKDCDSIKARLTLVGRPRRICSATDDNSVNLARTIRKKLGLRSVGESGSILGFSSPWRLLASAHPAAAQNWTGTSARTDVNWISVASSADGTKLLAAGGYPTWSAYVSSDSGASWTGKHPEYRLRQRGFVGGWNEIGGGAKPFRFCVCLDQFRSDLGANQLAGIALAFYLASSADGSQLAAIGQDQQPGPIQIYVSGDSGNTWALTSASGRRIGDGLACSADGNRLVASIGGNGGFYTSTDAGATWTQQTNQPSIWWGAVASSGGWNEAGVGGCGGRDLYFNPTRGPTGPNKPTRPSRIGAADRALLDERDKVDRGVRSGFGAKRLRPDLYFDRFGGDVDLEQRDGRILDFRRLLGGREQFCGVFRPGDHHHQWLYWR